MGKFQNYDVPFSQELEAWVSSSGSKTLFSLDKVFAEKSFAIIFIFLLAPSALPIPTGIITVIFEIIAIIVASQMIIGRRNLWLPASWRAFKIGGFIKSQALPKLISFIRWFERYSKPRGAGFLGSKFNIRLFGALVIIFCIGALLSPPFSGLDTLPSLGVVIISLAIVLEDYLLYFFGIIVGLVGILLLISVGALAFKLFEGLL